MAEKTETKITWNLNIQIAGGPTIAKAGTQQVEAYDKIDVVIPGAAGQNTDVEVQILPAGTEVQFLLLLHSESDDTKDKLTYTVNL